MKFALKPDDNGIVVVIDDVDENDIPKLESAEKRGFDPTEEPFNKYYDYDYRVGFYVGKSHFDHAEHKGKRLSFGEYMKIISNGDVIIMSDAIQAAKHTSSADDADFDADFIFDRINRIKLPKNLNDATVAMSNLLFAMHKLADKVDMSDESQKPAYRKAMQHAFDVYHAADDIIFKSNYNELMKLSKQLDEHRNVSAELQSKLLEKYHENF